jgi:ADP-ribose pyrophosphatase YjhB (NUDIX family)
MIQLESELESLKLEAIEHCVNLSGYLDETNDTNEVIDCTNAWNMEQKDIPGEASDYINIVKDLDGIVWVLLITRLFGPGRNQDAFPGGFREIGETFEQAGNREGDEETELDLKNSSKYSTVSINITEKHSYWHDPRGKFKCGMINGAVVHYYDFSLLN